MPTRVARPSASPHGGLIIAAVTGLCLAAFLVSIPFPRVDGQLIGGDGVGYYIYLPSMVLDRDLDFTNQAGALRPAGDRFLKERTATGLRPTLWPVGPALLWLPFFVLAHALAILLNACGATIRLDGCGYWHQAFVIGGNIIYGGIGMALSCDAVRRVASPMAAVVSTLLLVCAGNLSYYLTGEPSMAHPVSVFAVSCFFWYWIRRRHDAGARRAIVLGSLAGLIALVRTQEVLLAVVPLASDLVEGAGVSRTRLRNAALTGLAAAALCLPQLVVSQRIFGAWWVPPQLHAGWNPGGALFTWWSPHFVDVLVSAHRGLFTWHPVYALAMIGVVPLWRRDRWLAAAVVAGLVSQAYVTGAWYDWAQGRSFGGRAFIGCLPLLATSLASLWDAAASSVGRRRLAVAALGLVPLLLVANLLLMIEFRLVISRADRQVTWHDLGAGRITAWFPK